MGYIVCLVNWSFSANKQNEYAISFSLFFTTANWYTSMILFKFILL